jgi:hypothetical protein
MVLPEVVTLATEPVAEPESDTLPRLQAAVSLQLAEHVDKSL